MKNSELWHPSFDPIEQRHVSGGKVGPGPNSGGRRGKQSTHYRLPTPLVDSPYTGENKVPASERLLRQRIASAFAYLIEARDAGLLTSEEAGRMAIEIIEHFQ